MIEPFPKALPKSVSNEKNSHYAEVLAIWARWKNISVNQCPALSLKALSGLTNDSLLVDDGNDRVVMRFPGHHTSLFLNRSSEISLSKVAAEAGISPPLLYSETRTGVIVSQFVQETPQQGSTSPSHRQLLKLMTVLRKTHGLKVQGLRRWTPNRMLNDYQQSLVHQGIRWPSVHATYEQRFYQLCHWVEATRQGPLVSCHNDPHWANVLQIDADLLLVDWEYGSVNDPLWDIAIVCEEVRAIPELQLTLLEAYYNNEVPTLANERLLVMRALVSYVCATWSCLFASLRNDPIFGTLERSYLNRFESIIEDEEFQAQSARLGNISKPHAKSVSR